MRKWRACRAYKLDMGRGRPSTYSEEIAAEICGRLAAGEALTHICRDEHMPAVITVYAWQLRHPEFASSYARAREDQADTYADEIVCIADEVQIGETTTVRDGVVEKVTGDMVQRSKLRIDARKWVAAKLKPRRYGDRIQTEHSGSITIEDLVTGGGQ